MVRTVLRGSSPDEPAKATLPASFTYVDPSSTSGGSSGGPLNGNAQGEALVPNPALRDSLVAAFDPSQLRLLLFGLTLVIMMIVRPEGLVPSARRRVELHERPALGEAGEQPPAPSEVASLDAGGIMLTWFKTGRE